MRGYGVLAGRYLKQQRRRSLLTVLGIVLSVALISALLTMGQALKDNMLDQQIYEQGAYHFGYPKPEAKLYDKLKGHALVDKVAVVRMGSETQLDDVYKIYVYEVNKDAYELTPIHLSTGRLPESPDELAAEEWIVQRLPGKPKLGDQVTLNAADGKPHVYRLVGLLKNEQFTQMERSSRAYSLLPVSAPAPGAKSEYHDQLFVSLKSGADIGAHLDEFSKLGDPFSTNTRVLALMGQSPDSGLNRALMVIFGTLVGLVVLSTIAVIYNAFHISVLERIRQFGLLRTIGATPRQIRSLVFREATVLAGIGIPLGLALGWGALWLVLWLMIQGGFHILQMEQFQLTFHWWIMGLSVGVGIAAVYLAAWLPARKASRVSPVDAVKGAGSIVRESYRRARLPSPLRLLGIEGKMASTNIRRNRTKFRITTFSIVVSVTLFIVFHYFTQEAFKLTVDTTANNKIAFEIGGRIIAQEDTAQGGKAADFLNSETLDRITQLPGVEAVYGRYNTRVVSALVPDTMVNENFEQKMNIHFVDIQWNGEQRRAVSTYVQLYDDARLSKAASYLKSGTADAAKLDESDGVILIQTVKPYLRSDKKKQVFELTGYKVGDTLTLQMGDNPTDEKTARQVKILGILSESAFDRPYEQDALTVIVTKNMMQKLLDAPPLTGDPFGTALMGVQVALKDGADSEPVRIALEQITADIPGAQLVNIVDRQREQRQFAVQMQIFVYGFLAVIGLIGSLNIINTVQTNLLLRRREMGLLQAVGMTMGQIRRMATAEGAWFGVIGGFWGLLLGGGLSYFLYSQLTGIEGIPFVFPWGGALIACVFALGVGLLSVQGPLRKMAKANLIEELREDA
ncbi:ABC transporter permease [Cohnella pontilimi]|uniref:ABC transporter permease n=1 Tax=Cohnella pontilimi TaxID=2564100 RepID=A0A4V5LRE2_9BACL|nr:ABC transporter permease [Cohnella pontilimi]TJY38929.1 ABC transporter permease [Cohnella pontilimi]